MLLLPLLQEPLGEVVAGTAFQRVWVDYLVQGPARITWTFLRHFDDPSPATWGYTLQVSSHGPLPTFNADGRWRGDDWVSVVGPETNVAVLYDTLERRAVGKSLLIAYRVRLTTPRGIYYSPPATTLGALNKQDWLRAREILRKELLLHKKATSIEGYLLKRKRQGEPCSNCLDPATGEVTLSRCRVCNGQRYEGGFFAPIPYSFCRIEPNATREHREIKSVGAQKTDVTRGRILALPGLESNDAWIDAVSDRRYYIHVQETAAQLRGVPLIYTVEMRQAPLDDPLYQVDLDESN